MLMLGKIMLGVKSTSYLTGFKVAQLISKKNYGEGVVSFSRHFVPVESGVFKKDLSQLFSHLEDEYSGVEKVELSELQNKANEFSLDHNLGVKIIVAQYTPIDQLDLHYHTDGKNEGRLMPILVRENFDLSLNPYLKLMVNGEEIFTVPVEKETTSDVSALTKEGKSGINIEDVSDKAERKSEEIHGVMLGYHGIGMGHAYLPSKPDINSLQPKAITSKEEAQEEIVEIIAAFRAIIKEIKVAQRKYKGSVKEQKFAELSTEDKNVHGSLVAFISFLESKSELVQDHIATSWQEGAEFLSAMRTLVLPEIQGLVGIGKTEDDGGLDKFGTLGDDFMGYYEAVILAKYKLLPDLMVGMKESVRETGEKVVLVCGVVKPHEAASLEKEFVDGMIEERGGIAAHATYAAEGLEIPNVYGCSGAINKIRNGDFIIIDGITGKILINPVQSVVKEYESRHKKREEYRKGIQIAYKDKKAVTLDNANIGIFGNARSLVDMSRLNDYGVQDGLGLVRSENFFSVTEIAGSMIERESAPSEEEQIDFYGKAITLSRGGKVVFRTFDVVGGDLDKSLPYLKAPEKVGEKYNGINICLNKKEFRPYYELFKGQIKALLKAGLIAEREGKQMVIEFPFVLNSEVFGQAMEVVKMVMRELDEDGQEYSKKVQFGSMVECSSAVEDIDMIAQTADFLSIGSNDLAASVTSSSRYNTFAKRKELDPEVLDAIRDIVAAGKKHNKPVVICGDMAADIISIPVLIGLGVENLSIEAGPTPFVKAFISSIHRKDCEQLVEDLKNISTAEESRKYVASFIEDKMNHGDWPGLKTIWQEIEPIIWEAQGKKLEDNPI